MRLRQLTLVALGVVYGDIGTSPLYALQECFKPQYHLAATPANVYGVLSLVVWALLLVVSLKYLVFILRADNRGEGGVLALLALLLQQQRRDADRNYKQTIVVLGLIGAALLYGDGIITPAISVLSAMEGLKVITPKLSVPNAERIFFIRHALRAGISIDEIFSLTKIDRWFLTQIKEIVDFEEELATARN